MVRVPDPQMVQLIITSGAKVTLQQWEMNNLSSVWRRPTERRQRNDTADAVYRSLLLICNQCQVNGGAAGLGDLFWANVGLVVGKDELAAVRETLRGSSAPSRMFGLLRAWAGLNG